MDSIFISLVGAEIDEGQLLMAISRKTAYRMLIELATNLGLSDTGVSMENIRQPVMKEDDDLLPAR